MRVSKPVINKQTGAHLPCCWMDCWRDGVEVHKVRVRSGEEALDYVFCSERHRQFFIHSHRAQGMLPPGYRLAVT